MGVAQPLEATKTRLTRVALEMFAARGYDNVSVTEIAKMAGTSQPSLHYHFKTKRGLWEDAMRLLAHNLQPNVSLQTAIGRSLDPLSALKAACAILIEQSNKMPDLGRVILSEGQAGGERLTWLMREVFADNYDVFIKLIKSCIETGQIKPYKPYQVLMLLHGAAVTHFNVAPLVETVFGENVREPDNVASFQRMYMDIVFEGLIKK